MLEPQAPFEQVVSNPDSVLLNKLTSSSAMSAECESVVPQTLGPQSLHHSSAAVSANGMRNDKNHHSGISYEGRVSLISPFINYSPTVRSSIGVEHHPSSFLPSPPFGATHTQMTSLITDQFAGFSYGEDNRRHQFRKQTNPSTSKDSFDSFNMYPNHMNGINFPIKVEHLEESLEDDCSQQPHKEAKGTYDPISMFQFAVQEKTLETTPEPKKPPSPQKNSPQGDEQHKDLVCTPTRLPPLEALEDGAYFNDDNGSEPSSPCHFQGNEENIPSSLDSDPEDSQENEADMNLMEQSFEESPGTVEHGENSKSLKCQHCSYSTDLQFHFVTHVNTHFDHKCVKCEFTTHTIAQLKEHTKEEHDSTPEEIDELGSIRVPRVNSQGKVKTFKCKQCGYVAITKGDFWEHARTHIKSEKLLTCNKCPFVTEYKHHLEYHLRNHFGSKPYKCSKCSYSCVNKSMLNSHMKSHSNVYQYRCSDCTYATKYCHSLKLHLRKYGHTPAMVLNPDGTPNPVPIIDIYGTRRGPKLKKDENGMPILPPQYQLQAHLVRTQMQVTGTIPPAPTAPLEKQLQGKSGSGRSLNVTFPPPPSLSLPNPFSTVPNSFSYPSFIPQEFRSVNEQMSQPSECREQLKELEKEKVENLNASKSPEVTEEPLECEICDFSTPSKDVLAHHRLLHSSKERVDSEVASSPVKEREVKSNILEQKNDTQPLPSPTFNHMNGLPPPGLLHQTVMTQNFQEYLARAINPLLYQGIPHPAFDFHQHLRNLAYHKRPENDIPVRESSPNRSSPVKNQDSTLTHSNVVLDLSKEQTPPHTVASSGPAQSSSSKQSTSSTNSPYNSDISTPPAKNRRKGRAYKLERIALRLSGSGEDPESSSPEGNEESKETAATKTKGRTVSSPLAPRQSEIRGTQTKDSKWVDAHHCQYCDIAFKDTVLYTMHMGFHGFKDAFTCNSCGFKAKDKINFSLHIARSAHD